MTSQPAVREMVPRRYRTSRASSQYSNAMDSLPLLFDGMAMSTFSMRESVSQSAMTGMLAYDASFTAWESVRGSVTISRRGSMYFVVIWFVRVSGIQRPAMACAPVYWLNFSTAREPYGRCEATMMSSGFSMATMARAATMTF